MSYEGAVASLTPFLAAAILCGASGCAGNSETAAATPTTTLTRTPSASPTATRPPNTPTERPSPSPTATYSRTPTPSPTAPGCTRETCPDLVAGDIFGVFPPPAGSCIHDPGDIPAYQLNVCVKNAGDAQSGPFEVKIDFRIYRIDGIAAHAQDCRLRPYTRFGELILDDLDEVAESNELNNRRDFSVAIPSYPPTCQPTSTPTPTRPTPTATQS